MPNPIELDSSSRPHEATCWNFLASMHRHIGSRQALLVKFRTDQVGIKRDKSGAEPAVDGQAGPNIVPGQ